MKLKSQLHYKKFKGNFVFLLFKEGCVQYLQNLNYIKGVLNDLLELHEWHNRPKYLILCNNHIVLSKQAETKSKKSNNELSTCCLLWF